MVNQKALWALMAMFSLRLSDSPVSALIFWNREANAALDYRGFAIVLSGFAMSGVFLLLYSLRKD